MKLDKPVLQVGMLKFLVALQLFTAVVFTVAAVVTPPGEPVNYFGLFAASQKSFFTVLAIANWLYALQWGVRLLRVRVPHGGPREGS